MLGLNDRYWWFVCCIITKLKTETQRKTRPFFSTDTQQAAQAILDIYQARFQIEFCFRDAKQFSGLLDCQSRQQEAINFHWNMAFLAVNLTRAEQRLRNQHQAQTFVFSMEDAKRRAYNHFFAEKIFRFLPQSMTFDNYHRQLDSLLNLGVKAA